jgi:6-pyruvoyltetrahydropterin/6-carboxytetrahydropterin synthase
MTTIRKIFYSETAHIVRQAFSQSCAQNVHGHSYKWEVEIEGPLNKAGMVLDFGELKPIKQFINLFDHAMILWEKDSESFKQFFLDNCERVVIMKENTTAENMAKLVYKFVHDWLRIKKIPFSVVVKRVSVYETSTGCGIAEDCDESDVLVFFKHKMEEV